LRTVLKLEPGFPQGSEGTAPVAPAGSEPFPAPEFLEAAEAAALAGMMQPLIDALPEQIALLDNQGTIVAANRAWRKIVREHGHEEASLGRNYRDFCVISAATGYQPAVEALAALDDLASGRRKFWQLVYNGGERWSHHDFRICFHNIAGGDRPLILVTRFDLTEVLALRRLKREFGISLTKTQALERERLARELHDSTAQSLAAAGLLVGRFRHDTPNEEILEAVDELQQLLGEAQQEIRLIAYLAHPPALEKMGLAGALESLLVGVSPTDPVTLAAVGSILPSLLRRRGNSSLLEKTRRQKKAPLLQKEGSFFVSKQRSIKPDIQRINGIVSCDDHLRVSSEAKSDDIITRDE